MRHGFRTTTPVKLACAAAIVIGFGLMAIQAKKPESIKGRYAFRMTAVKSFSAEAPGDPGAMAAAPRQDILRVGVFTADGDGNLTGRTIATTDTNAGHTWIITFNWTGKYTLDADGNGFFSVDSIHDMVCTDTTVSHTGSTPHPSAPGGTPAAGNITCPGDVEGHEDYAFVFSTPGGKQVEFIQTDNGGGGAKIFLAGTATRQEDQGLGELNGGQKENENQN